jgi:tetratricopeptide (TPR) repeat protein
MRATVSVVVVFCFLAAQVQAAPSGAARHFKAGQAQLDIAEYDKAIAEFKAALDLDASPEYLFWLGQAYRLKKEKKTALDFYKQYLAIAPNGAQATQAKVYVASLTMEVEEQARREAPPPPPPQAYAPSTYTPPPIYDRKLMRQRLSICVEGPDDWAYCGYKQRTIGENEFISRYHAATGRADLDENIDLSYRRRPLIINGIVSGASVALIIIGGLVAGLSPRVASDGSNTAAGLTTGITFASLASGTLFFSTVVGWPVAFRQPRSLHKLSQARAQAAVDAYNQALLNPFQKRD